MPAEHHTTLTPDTPVRYLKGVGPKTAERFEKLGIVTLADLLCHYPRRYIDFSRPYSIAEAPPDTECVVKAEVFAKPAGRILPGGRRMERITAGDDVSSLEITWFNNPYAAQKLELGQEYYFEGIVTGGMLRRQMVNPQVRTDAQVKSSPFEAVYPQTEGLTSSAIAKCVRQLLPHAELLPFEQLQALKEEMRSVSREHLGVQLPLYPITPAGERAGEGVEALRTCVQEVLKRSPLTDRRVERLLLATDRLLEEQGKVLNELHRLSKLDSGFLTSIDREIDRIQLQMEEEMPARLKAYAQYVQDCVPRLGKKSARQLGRFLSIRRTMILHKLPPVIDEWFYELVKSGIEERHAYYNKEFLNICQTHWNHVRPRVREQWDCDIGEFPAARLQADLEVYKERLGRSVYMPLKDFGIKPCLSKLFLDQEDVMRTELKLMLVMVILGALLGSFGEHGAGFACLGVALVLWLSLIHISEPTRH